MMRENPPRVLVVDDSRDTADSMVVLLGLWGYAAEACYESTAAVAAARAYQPQVVLLDIAMPRIDGFEIARRLRAESALRHTALIALTGYTNEASRLRAQESGFHHYLVKPVELDDVRELLLCVAGSPGLPKPAPADEADVLPGHRSRDNALCAVVPETSFSDAGST